MAVLPRRPTVVAAGAGRGRRFSGTRLLCIGRSAHRIRCPFCPTARMAVLQLNKNLARERLQLRTSGLVPLMHKCDPEIGTEISRNRRAIRVTESDCAWPTQSNPAVYTRGGMLAQPLQWARDDTLTTSGTKRPASMKTRRRTNYV
jgi:hypothetical protein